MNLKVLIIHQESDFTEECIRLFTEKEWGVEHCTSGFGGVGKAHVFLPDIVLIGEEIKDCNPLIVAKNIASAPLSKPVSIVFLATEDFYKKHQNERDRWGAYLHYCVKEPVTAQELLHLCQEIVSPKKETLIESAYQKILYPFFKTEVGGSEIVAEGEKVISGDLGTLKQYVSMKEKEMTELQQDFNRAKEQLHIAQEGGARVEGEYKKALTRCEEFSKKIEFLTQENEEWRRRYHQEVEFREQENRAKNDKILMLERKLEIAQKSDAELKERVKHDIHHIRVRERELEAKLEILKRDSETLVSAKDRKHLELKRKIDALQYDIEILIEKEKLAARKVEFWKERIGRVLRALKMGTSLLESEEDMEIEQPEQQQEETQPTAKKTLRRV